ncbi:SAGA complex subunit Sgf73 [Saxophila tyrrhenica]|uniref:SAGA complex subunit Sgf73 n=1 Tax=Saxophila tyrrhenica TaxID=1690608 RepID=A0AAV9PNR8_9PEZI|nr:SAGA complex subunit Sgf73 [Saxophila tyrrhenica]
MAPNGSSRKSKHSFIPQPQGTLHSYATPTDNMDLPAPAPSRLTNGDSNGRTSISLENLFDDVKEERSPRLEEDAKRRLPTVRKPGSWDSEGPTSTNASTRSSPAPGSMNKVPSSLSKAFPNNRPLADKADIQKCTHCKRAVTKHTMPKHVESCLNKKQEKQRKKKEAKDARDAAARKEKNAANGVADSDEDAESTIADGSKPTASKTGLGGGAKKRKAADPAADDNTPEAPAKKKSKKSGSTNETGKAGASKPKPKAPVDVEKQCGVDLPQGGQCARSLTCKSHSMGAKRSVPGRSAPYDKLLADYQRKNQAKLQKAAFDASAPDPEDEGSAGAGPVDSDEERDGVMAGIARAWGGAPLYQRPMAPLRARYQHNRIRGMLQSAFANRGAGGGGTFGSGGGGGGFFGGSSAAATTNPTAGPSSSSAAPASATTNTGPSVDDNGIVHARRGSVVPGARSMMAPAANRKANVANTNSNGTPAAVGA